MIEPLTEDELRAMRKACVPGKGAARSEAFRTAVVQGPAHVMSRPGPLEQRATMNCIGCTFEGETLQMTYADVAHSEAASTRPKRPLEGEMLCASLRHGGG